MDQAVDDGLMAGTKCVTSYEVEIDGQKIVLLDTPGFGDKHFSDFKILEAVAEFFGRVHNKPDTLLSGIIFTHAVDQPLSNRYNKAESELMKKIYGSGLHPNLVIATTFWEHSMSRNGGEMIVQHQVQEFWKDAIEAGARMMLHDNLRSSAIHIIRNVMNKDRATLQLQQELDKYQGSLVATAVGQQLNSNMNERHQQLLHSIFALDKSIKDAKANPSTSSSKTDMPGRRTSEAWEEMQERVKKLEAEQEKLANKRVSMHSEPSEWLHGIGSFFGGLLAS